MVFLLFKHTAEQLLYLLFSNEEMQRDSLLHYYSVE